MGSLHETSQLVSRNHGDALVALAAYNHDLMVVGYSVEHRRQALTEVRVGGFSHIQYCTGKLYVVNCILQSSSCQKSLHASIASSLNFGFTSILC